MTVDIDDDLNGFDDAVEVDGNEMGLDPNGFDMFADPAGVPAAGNDHPFGLDLSKYQQTAGAAQEAEPSTDAEDTDAQPDTPFGIDLSAYRNASPAPEPAEVSEAGPAEPDSEKYYPAIAYDIPEADTAPSGVQAMGTPEQRTLAISRLSDPSAQMRMFAVAGDVRNLYNLTKQIAPPQEDQAAAIAEEVGVPEGMVKLLQKYEPDKLEARRLAAHIQKTLGPDDYVTRKLSGDPRFVADWREEAKELADLQAVVNSTHASTAGITWDWFAGTVAGTANQIAVGIPAAASQAVRELREGQLQEPRSGFSGRMDRWFDSLDDWLQGAYKATSAAVYQPPAETGSWAMDTAARPVVQGLGSYLPSMGAGIIARGATSVPALLFGASEGGEGYRERAAAGVDPITNAFSSLAQTGLSAWAEHISLDTAFSQPGLRSLWRKTAGNSNTLLSRAGRMVGGGLKAGGGEAVAEGLQTGLELATTPLAKGISFGDSPDAIAAEVSRTLWDNSRQILEAMWGGFGAGVIGGGTVGDFGREMADAWSFSRFQKSLERVAPAAGSLATKKGDIKQSRDQLRNILYDGISQGKTDLTATSYADALDVERYTQALPEAEATAFLDSLGTTRAALEQAIENKIDIEVPTENILVMAGGSKPEVRAMFRPKPSMPTAAFMRSQLDSITETFTLAESMKVGLEEKIEKGLVPEGIAQFHRDQVAMKKTTAEARANTALLWAWVQTQAARRGVTPEEFSADNTVHAVADAFMRSNPAGQAEVRESGLREQPLATSEPAFTSERLVELEAKASLSRAEMAELDAAAEGMTGEQLRRYQVIKDTAQFAPEVPGPVNWDAEAENYVARGVTPAKSARTPRPAATDATYAAWLDQATGDILRGVGMEGEQFAPLAVEVRKALEQDIQNPDVRALAEALGIELPAGQAAVQAEAAGGETALQNTGATLTTPSENVESIAQTRQAVRTTVERESLVAAGEANAIDRQAAKIEAALASGEILAPEQMNRLGVRAGDRAGMADRAAALREEALRWRNYRQFPDVLAKVQDLAGTGVTEADFAAGEVGRYTQSALRQGDPQSVRGDVILYEADPVHHTAAVIRTLEQADHSTVPNLLGHIFFDDMRRWVMSGNADNAARRDFATLTQWAGRLSVDAGLAKDSSEYARQKAEVNANIEKVSRGFEAYLRDGRAPSLELVDSFSLFSTWLTRVYRSIREYVGFDLSPNIREVYDRWLASEAEITEARAYYADTDGLALLDLIPDDAERRKLKEERSRRSNRTLDRFAGDRVLALLDADTEQAIAEAQADIDADPAYRAIAAARFNPLDRAGAVALVGEQTVRDIVARHGDIFTDTKKASPDAFVPGLEELAAIEGYSGGDAMLRAMAEAPNAAAFLEADINRRLVQQAADSRLWATENADRPGDAALHNPADDIEGGTIDLTRQAIRRAMTAEEKLRGVFIDRSVIDDQARYHLTRMTERRAADYSNWATAERRWAIWANEAAARGDRVAALQALDRQQYFHALVTESFRIRQERQAFDNQWRRRAEQTGLTGVKEAFRQPMLDILTTYSIAEAPYLRPERSDPHRLVPPKESDGFTVNGRTVDEDLEVFESPLAEHIPAWLQEKRKPDNYLDVGDLTVTQMRELDQTLGMLESRGLGELTALRTDRAATIDELRNAIVAEMDALPDYKADDSRTWKGKTKKAGETYIVSNLTMDRIAAGVDGNPMLKGKEMGTMQNLVRIIRGREVEQMKLLEDFRRDSADDFAILDSLAKSLEKQFGSKYFPVDGAEVPELIQTMKGVSTWDADMLSSIFFHIGNRDNRYTLQKGLGISDQSLARLASLATIEQWKAIERIGRRIGAFYPDLDAVYFRQNNRHMSKVEATPFTVQAADGAVNLEGWYFPKHFDPELASATAAQSELAGYQADMAPINNPAAPVDGFTRARATDADGNPVVTRPLLLKTSVLVNHMNNMTRWVSFAEPLAEFRRLVADPVFKKTFLRKLGPEKYQAMREWSNRMARPDKGKDTGRNRILGKARNLSTIASVGYNLVSALGQAETLGLAADAMSKGSRDRSSGWYWLVQGLKEMGLGGVFGGWVGHEANAVARMNDMSTEAKMHFRNVNKEVRELIESATPGKKTGVLDRLNLPKAGMFHFARAVKQTLGGIVWWGSYHQAVEGHAGFDTAGLTDAQVQEKAIAYADSVLRSQQSPFKADFTKMQTDSGALGLFSQFIGEAVPYLQHTVGMAQEARRGGVSKADFTASIVNMYVLPTFASTVAWKLIRRGLFGDDDDDESIATAFAWGVVNSMAAPLPGVRDAVGIGQHGVRSAMPRSLSVPTKAASRAAKGVMKLAVGDVEAAASEFGRAIREMLPANHAVNQVWRGAKAVGLVK